MNRQRMLYYVAQVGLPGRERGRLLCTNRQKESSGRASIVWFGKAFDGGRGMHFWISTALPSEYVVYVCTVLPFSQAAVK